MSPEYERGYRDTIVRIKNWHEQQARLFQPIDRLTDDQARQFRWAAASHSAHACYIASHFWQPPGPTQ